MINAILSRFRRYFSFLVIIFGVAAPTLRAQSTYTVTSTADDGSAGTLRWAITQADANLGSTINLNNNLGTITLGSILPLVTTSVTINGGSGNTVSGAGQNRILFVDAPSASVSISNLTLANGYAKGGDGGGGGWVGGGGGLGAGGAIFVNAGSVSLSSVSFANSQAIGGNGGSADNVPGAGGGGGLGGNGGSAGNGFSGGGGAVSSATAAPVVRLVEATSLPAVVAAGCWERAARAPQANRASPLAVAAAVAGLP